MDEAQVTELDLDTEAETPGRRIARMKGRALPPALPPPGEEEKVTTAVGASRAEQSSEAML